MTLAQKWRPKNFKEVVGQDHLVHLLQEALKKNHGGPFLFVGGRGLGKTTLARLYAQELLKDSLERHPDFIEIDGASYNGVDEIREIIEQSSYPPLKASYKIYLIDEVHMLSQSAFNALLKILEEPPKHLRFLFATTEKHKIPLTVLSRVLVLHCEEPTVENLISFLKLLFKKESKEAEDLVFEKLAFLAQGSYRDALTLVEPLFLQKDFITYQDLKDYFGLIDQKTLNDLFTYVLKGNWIEVKKILNNIFSIAFHQEFFIRDFLKVFFQKSSEDIQNLDLLWCTEVIFKDLQWIDKSPLFQEPFTLLLQKITLRHYYQGTDQRWKKILTLLSEEAQEFYSQTLPFIEDKTIYFDSSFKDSSLYKDELENLGYHLFQEEKKEDPFSDPIIQDLEKVFGNLADTFIGKDDSRIFKRSH